MLREIPGPAGPLEALLDEPADRRRVNPDGLVESGFAGTLRAAVVFAHYPEIKKVRTEFIWLKEGDEVSTREDFTRADMASLWTNLSPRLFALKQAHGNVDFPPTHNYLCRRWCPVTMCKHHGN